MKKNKENPDNLVSLFADRNEGLRILREIEQAEAVLAASSEALPSGRALAAIKQKVRAALALRQKRRMYARLWVGAAACAVTAALIGLLYLDGRNEKSNRTPIAANSKTDSVIWSENDPQTAALMQEIETIADELEAGRLQWGYTDSAHSRLSSAVDEMELVAANLDFWKG